MWRVLWVGILTNRHAIVQFHFCVCVCVCVSIYIYIKGSPHYVFYYWHIWSIDHIVVEVEIQGVFEIEIS